MQDKSCLSKAVALQVRLSKMVKVGLQLGAITSADLRVCDAELRIAPSATACLLT